jgi:hypothetical protein
VHAVYRSPARATRTARPRPQAVISATRRTSSRIAGGAAARIARVARLVGVDHACAGRVERDGGADCCVSASARRVRQAVEPQSGQVIRTRPVPSVPSWPHTTHTASDQRARTRSAGGCRDRGDRDWLRWTNIQGVAPVRRNQGVAPVRRNRSQCRVIAAAPLHLQLLLDDGPAPDDAPMHAAPSRPVRPVRPV